MIDGFQDCVIIAISEIADNCLKGNIPLNKCQFKKLEKYKSILRFLQSKSEIVQKRKHLKQVGRAFFAALIPPALSLIASVLAPYIEKLVKK